ncbi:MAG: right-handed parallel beta-helix repeat-containing protein, partial [Candidatus Anstonellales archaeon]
SSKPYLLTPFPGEFVSGTYHITWSNVYDYNNDSLQFNITLLNPDLTYNATIVSNYGNSSSTQYDWDSTLYEDGVYSMEILVFENETPEGLSNSYTLFGNFTIDNTKPSIWFEPPTETSGTTVYRNYILVNVSANDTNLNVIGIFLYNSTGGLLNETYSSTSPFFVNFTNLADGLYYFNATAVDLAENQNWTETRNVSILTQGCVGVTKTFRCGEIINESCTMTSNLYSNGTCFTVKESNVQINCSGFSIKGNSSGYGILVQNTTNFSIIDCIIGNFSSSIHVLNTNNSLFKNNTLFKSQYGMFMDPSYNNTIIENQIFANSNIGLYLNASHNNTIRNNTFENNTNTGLKLEYSTNNKIEPNIVKNNTEIGIFIIYSNLNNITQNNCSLASDCILISDSNYSLISENFVYSNDRTGIRLDPYSLGNNVTNNRVEDANQKCIYSSSNTLVLIKNNTARNCSEDGIFLHNSNNVTVLENAVHESYYGITVYVSNNTNLTDNHVYNNTQDMLVSSDDFNIYNIYIKNLTVDNPLGNFENYTSLDIIDSFGSPTQEEAYIINWTQNSTSLPTDRISFAQKFVEIYPGGGEVSIDSISWTWLDSELTGYYESMFELWKYNSSGWTMLNNTPDTTNNRLSLSNMNPASIYGMLQGAENCPVITSPGAYIQTQNYVGAPNNASPLSGVACVKIAASNVLYDCNGYNITNNGTSGDTYGVLLNGSLLNVTIKNCPSISNYTYGVYVYASNETVILNVTAHNNTQDGIHLRLSSKSIIANSTAYNNSWVGFYLSESENNTIYNNIAYNNPNGGFRIAENSHGNSVFNNTAYKNDNGFWLFTNSTNNFVYNNTAHSNANSGFYVYSSFNNISNNTAYNNSLWGFHIISPYNKIFGNAAYNNTYYGFVLSSSANDTLIFDNVANNNSDDGFWISSSNNIIFNNTAYNQIGSDHCGFRLYGLTARNNKVYNNTAYNNGRGFYLYMNPHNNTFYDNIAYDNSEMGFVLASSSDNTFIHNIAYTNSLTGFYFWQDSNNNYVANNTAYDNKYGFYLWASYNNTLYNNTAYDNWQHGFNIEFGDANILINNTIYNNTQSGITLWSTFNNTLSSNIVRNNLKIGIQLNPDSGNNNLTQNYVCFNSIFDINNTNSTNIGEDDKCDSWDNWNESGHEGCTYRCTKVWHYFFGNISGEILLAKNSTAVFYSWIWNGQKGKVYVVNGDANIEWINLTALGRNVSGENSTNDFTELDTLLGYSAEPDNINATYSTDGSNPKETKDIILWKRLVQFIPVANSTTQNSVFKTGICWDASQGGPEFSIAQNQDVVFLTEINSSATYNYEIRVPANLSTYKGSSGVIEFWVELE